jgi:hypothetical protein
VVFVVMVESSTAVRRFTDPMLRRFGKAGCTGLPARVIDLNACLDFT